MPPCSRVFCSPLTKRTLLYIKQQEHIGAYLVFLLVNTGLGNKGNGAFVSAILPINYGVKNHD